MKGEKVLYIVRHGKSSWDDQSLADIDRSLKDRGVSDAYEMAGRIKSGKEFPGKIISSPAIRALHTAVIFSRVIGIPDDRIGISERLYLASTAEMISFIGETPEKINSLMIFGHNPGFTSLANSLSNLAIANIPTCGYVRLDFKTDSWKKIGRNYLSDELFDFPSNT